MSGFSNALRVVGLVVLACAIAQPAAAQVTLISNLDGNDATQSFGLDDSRNKGMGFTMPAGDDYTLEYITLRLETASGIAPIVELWTDAAGVPGAVIETLSNPSFAPSGIANYDFTSTGTTLTAGASYWVVAYGPAGVATYSWKGSSPAQFPSGIASHLGATFDTNGPPPTSTSSIINSYSVTASLVAAGDADLAITKAGQTTGPSAGVYTIAVDNLGPDDASGVVVTDDLPGGVGYVSDDCGGVPGTPWTWNVGGLAASASVVCNITVDVIDFGDTVNVAEVTGNENDPDLGNNISTAQLPPFGGPIPTLGTLGLLVLVGIIAGSGLMLLRRLH
jgi:uncharacterized repeat protein (TIGR01451 family)